MRIEIDNRIIKIRNSSWDDYDYCHSLAKRNMLPFYKKHKLEWKPKDYRRHFNPKFIKLLEYNNRRIGFYEFKFKKGSWYLEDLHISGTLRGKGIGTKILMLLESIVKRKGCKNIMLSVFFDNPAVNLYKRIGYSVLEKQGSFYFMEKSL